MFFLRPSVGNLQVVQDFLEKEAAKRLDFHPDFLFVTGTPS